MRIAVPVEEKNIDTEVCPSFGRAPYFLIYDSETKKEEYLENTAANSSGGAGIKAGQFVADSKATALITPRCGQNAADVMLEAKIKIYKSDNSSVKENIEKLLENNLEELGGFHAGFHGRA